MRVGNVGGRLALITAAGAVDVHEASAGRFPADPIAVYERWDDFRRWAASAPSTGALPAAQFGAPSPGPRQVFAIGLNYADHAAESGTEVPATPPTFTKYQSSLTGPCGELVLPSDNVDWEAELVVVIGRRAEHVSRADGWAHVAGLTIGQDYSERAVQMAGAVPQFSLGKSYPGFGPIGPVLVTPDELDDPDDLAIRCLVNGELVQSSRTSLMIFPVAELVARLSAVCPLLPGDLIFTGTPSGVGFSRTPPRFLRPGDEVVTEIDGLGELVQQCVAPVGTHG